MKKFYIVILALASMVFASCQSDITSGGDTPQGDKKSGIDCSVQPLDIETYDETDGEGTRSSLTLDPAKGLIFSWSDEDMLSVYNESASSSRMDYHVFHNNGLTASFNADGFELKSQSRYYGFSQGSNSPHVSLGQSKFDFTNPLLMKVVYDGQRQCGNSNTDHLGAYDYMSATAVADGDNHADFLFKHLGLTVRAYIQGLTQGDTYTSMEMYDDVGAFALTDRTFNIHNGLSQDESDYTPSLDEVIESMLVGANKFTLRLAPKNADSETPDGLTVGSSGILDLFMEVPPTDLTGKTMLFKLTGTDSHGNAKNSYAFIAGKNLRAGKAVQLVMTALPADRYVMNIQVNTRWANTEVLGATRAAIGDPGVTEEFPAPEYMYWFFCMGNKLQLHGAIHVDGKDDTNSQVDELDKWSALSSEGVYSYGKPIEMQVASNISKTNVHVYVIGSPTPLSFTVKDGTTTESTIQALTTPCPDTQEGMKNLYSTPYPNDNAYTFTGDFGSEQAHVVTLQHVAAKYDVQWNVADAVNWSKISVGPSYTSDAIKIFTPTKNSPTSSNFRYVVVELNESNENQKYSGRAVVYGPQMHSSNKAPVYISVMKNGAYDYTQGNNNSRVLFTPAANGATSWFKLNLDIR